MTLRLAQVWRYPIKGIGAEALEKTTLAPGACLPGDRAFAVAHGGARIDAAAPGAWTRCSNFLRGASAPALMAVTARSDPEKGTILLAHPQRPDHLLDPQAAGAEEDLLAWLAPLWPEGRPAPARLVRVTAPGMTDTDYASVSILSTASLAALSEETGSLLDARRFRGNLWLDGCAPWEEFSWVGRRLALGEAVLRIEARITRCQATSADPETGTRHFDLPATLRARHGHEDFGVYAIVEQGGRVALGDTGTVL